MSLMFRELLRPLRMMEHQMRQAEELFRPTFNYYALPKIRFEDSIKNEESVVEDGEKYQVKMDMSDFKPDDIVIKTVNGNTIQIEAKHEVKHDNDSGYILKQVMRKFVLPAGHDIKKSTSTLSPDGILTVTTFKENPVVEDKKIPITHLESEQKNDNK